MSTPVKYGLYYFLVSTGITLALYLVDRNLFFNTWISLVTGFGLSILFIYLAIKEDRNDEGGYTLAEGLKVGIITYAIGTFLGVVFTYILTNFIDPALIEEGIQFAKDIAQKSAETVANMTGMPEADKARMMAELADQEIPNPFTLSKLVLGWVMNLIGGLILSLIVAAIMKKN